jgi:hypothetical protein
MEQSVRCSTNFCVPVALNSGDLEQGTLWARNFERLLWGFCHLSFLLWLLLSTHVSGLFFCGQALENWYLRFPSNSISMASHFAFIRLYIHIISTLSVLPRTSQYATPFDVLLVFFRLSLCAFPVCREELEKQRAKERYWKLHEQGKTEEARKDLGKNT